MIICKTENEARLNAVEFIVREDIKTVTVKKEEKGKWTVNFEVYSLEEYNFNVEGED